MKFFTLKWYREATEDGDFLPVFRRYTQHLEEMQGVLPAEALALAALPGVDDGLVVEVHHIRSQRILVLVLRCGDLQIGYYDLVLTYEGVQIEPKDEKILARIARTTRGAWEHQSDLAYHEVDQAEDGSIEHRLLFHPGLWFGIRCKALCWTKVDRPDRELPFIRDRFICGPAGPPKTGSRRGRLRAEPFLG